MNHVDIDHCYKTLMGIIKSASKIVLEGFKGNNKVEIKSTSHDVVTEYDKKTEICIIKSLSVAFPEHKFIGEETTQNNELTEEPTWIIDPIDGTANYIHRYPYSAISVGLSVNKEIILGVVCNPMLDQTFTAIKGRGAFLNGKRIKTSNIENLEEALVGSEISIAAYPRCTDIYVKRYVSCVTQVQGMRSIGCAQLSLCMVALGEWNAYHVEFLYPWDVAAGAIIVTEAGGCIIDIDGNKFDVEKGRCVAAGTENLARKLVNVIKVD